MKCPICNFELDEKNKCKKCGMTVSDISKNVEVEYKEFPKSEFLEIRTKPPAVSPENEHLLHPEESMKAELRKDKELLQMSQQRTSLKKKYFLIFIAGFLTGFVFLWLYLILKNSF